MANTNGINTNQLKDLLQDFLTDFGNIVNSIGSNNGNGGGSSSSNNTTSGGYGGRMNGIFFDDFQRKLDNLTKTIESSVQSFTDISGKAQQARDTLNNMTFSGQSGSEEEKIFNKEKELRLAEVDMYEASQKLALKKRQTEGDIIKAQTEYLKSQERFVEKLQKNQAREIEARTVREKWEAKGLNRIGNSLSKFKNESVGRMLGGAAGIGNAANGALNMIDSGKMDVGGMAGKVSGALSKAGPWGAAAGAAVDIFAKLFEMYSKVNTEASKYARTAGGGASAMYKMQRQMADYAKEVSKMGERAYDAAEFIKAIGEYSLEAGRNFEYLGAEGTKELYNLQQFGVNSKMISQFDTFGMSVLTVDERIAALYNNSSKKGLNAKAVQEKMLNNLKMAQNYTFANGVKALERMAQRSTELKMNMENVTRFADKVSTLEGALGAGAQLSVLGGNMAMMGNPLSMMYNALNDVEGLMDMSLGMTKGMAKFDSQKGQIDISAYDRQRLKAMADATGIDYTELTNQTMNQARENMVLSQMGGGLNEDTQQYIKNIAQIDKKGNAYVELNGQRVDVNKLTDEDKEQLKKESEAKDNSLNKGVGDIFNETRGIQERLDDMIKMIKAGIVDILVRKFGGGKKNQAMMQGMSRKNAEYYAKLARRSDSSETKQRLREMGATDKEMEDYENMTRRQQQSFIMNKLGGFTRENKLEYDSSVKNDYYGSSQGGVFVSLDKAMVRNYDNDKKENWGEIKKRQNGKYEEVTAARGGYISGPGTSTSDSIPARLSNGEFVVNADATAQNLSLLNKINESRGYRDGGMVKPSSSQYGSVGFANGGLVGGNSGNGTTVGFNRLNIDLSGTLKLDAGGFTKDIPADKILTGDFVDQIIKKVNERLNFGVNRDFLNQKYG